MGCMVTNDTIRTWRQKNSVVVVKCEWALTAHGLMIKGCEINVCKNLIFEIYSLSFVPKILSYHKDHEILGFWNCTCHESTLSQLLLSQSAVSSLCNSIQMTNFNIHLWQLLFLQTRWKLPTWMRHRSHHKAVIFIVFILWQINFKL